MTSTLGKPKLGLRSWRHCQSEGGWIWSGSDPGGPRWELGIGTRACRNRGEKNPQC